MKKKKAKRELLSVWGNCYVAVMATTIYCIGKNLCGHCYMQLVEATLLATDLIYLKSLKMPCCIFRTVAIELAIVNVA